MVWCYSEGAPNKYGSSYPCIACASRSVPKASTILPDSESSTPQSPGATTILPDQQTIIPNDSEIEVVIASPVMRCCCGCGVEASGSNHYCLVTGKQVTHLFIHINI